MKKIYLLFAALTVIAGCLNAQTTTRNLTWKLTGTQTWPTVGGTIMWTNK